MENTFMYKVFKENVLVDSKKHIWKVYFEEDVKINYRHFLITLLQQTNESWNYCVTKLMLYNINVVCDKFTIKVGLQKNTRNTL